MEMSNAEMEIETAFAWRMMTEMNIAVVKTEIVKANTVVNPAERETETASVTEMTTVSFLNL